MTTLHQKVMEILEVTHTPIADDVATAILKVVRECVPGEAIGHAEGSRWVDRDGNTTSQSWRDNFDRVEGWNACRKAMLDKLEDKGDE